MSGNSDLWNKLARDYEIYLRLEKNLAPNSVESYMRDFSQFREYSEERLGLPPTGVKGNDVEAFLAELYDRGMEKSTQARMLSGIRSLYNYMLLTDSIQELPTQFIDSPKMGRHLPDTLSIEEIDSIINTIDLSQPHGHRNKAMLETLYSCGLRVSELISLRISDLFFDDGFIRVTGKGSKQRLIPINDTARALIEHYLAQRLHMDVKSDSQDILFLNRRGRKMTRVMVFTIIKNCAKEAGIDKTVSPHTFRHSFATHLLEGGADIRQVQEMLGHESVTTTEIYTHLDRTHLSQSLNTHHPLAELFNDRE